MGVDGSVPSHRARRVWKHKVMPERSGACALFLKNPLPLPVMQLHDKNPYRQRLITDACVYVCVCARAGKSVIIAHCIQKKNHSPFNVCACDRCPSVSLEIK